MARFELDGERLKASGRLDERSEGDLRKWCLELFLTGADAITVDLSDVGNICSRCVGTLVTFWIDLCAAGRELQLITSPAVRRVLDLSGLSSVLLAPAEKGQFEIVDGELRARGKLQEHDEARFRKWCRQLLDTGVEVVRIDLSEVERICSRCVGTLAAVLVDLRGEGRGLRLVASPPVKKVLELAGLSSVFFGSEGEGGSGGR